MSNWIKVTDRVPTEEDASKQGLVVALEKDNKEAKFWVGEEIVVSKEMMLYAQWQEKSYEVKYLDQSYFVKYNCSFLVENNSIVFLDKFSKIIRFYFALIGRIGCTKWNIE